MINVMDAVAEDQQRKNEQARLLEEKKSAAKKSAENILADMVCKLNNFAQAQLPVEVKWEVETSLTFREGGKTNPPGGYEFPGYTWNASLVAQIEGYTKTNLGIDMSDEELLRALISQPVGPVYQGKVDI